MMYFSPFYSRSLLDVDPFDNYYIVSLQPSQGDSKSSSNQRSPPKQWTATLRLNEFKQDEVKVERSEDKTSVKVHARQGSGDDFSEVRKTIHIPDNVDRDQVDVDFTREGVLVVRAPYKIINKNTHCPLTHHQRHQNPLNCSFDKILSNEMRTLNEEMRQLVDHSFPGSMLPTFVQGDDGLTRLNMDFDLRGYKPDEISVQHDGDCVTVEAQHENKSDHGSSFKHFKRVFTLPDNVKGDELQCKLMQDGRLRLDAPCELKEQPQQSIVNVDGQNIPVQRPTNDEVTGDNESA